jgi:hypothetical protein
MFKLNALRNLRSAMSLLDPEEVRRQAERILKVGLVATSSSSYAEMEEFLLPPELPRALRAKLIENIYRNGGPDAPGQMDLYLYEPGLPCPANAFTFRRTNADATVEEIVEAREDIRLPLARWFPQFRKPVVDRIVQSIARENAVFAVVSALPNIVPSILDLPWAIGEFASDTAFITLNQVRMAFLIGAACGKKIGLSEQTAEVISIAGSAFGWRALARELAGKIPLGGGLIPKGAIAFAATFVIGKGIERLHDVGQGYSRGERRTIYRAAYERGKGIARALIPQARA